MPQIDFVSSISLTNMNEEKFEWFLDKIVRSVAGKREYDRMISHKILSEWVTVSDEAFAYLILEKVMLKRQWTEQQSAKKGGGWNDEGLDRFNELYGEVEEVRQEGERVSAEKKLLEERKKLREGKNCKRKRVKEPKKREIDISNDW